MALFPHTSLCHWPRPSSHTRGVGAGPRTRTGLHSRRRAGSGSGSASLMATLCSCTLLMRVSRTSLPCCLTSHLPLPTRSPAPHCQTNCLRLIALHQSPQWKRSLRLRTLNRPSLRPCLHRHLLATLLLFWRRLLSAAHILTLRSVCIVCLASQRTALIYIYNTQIHFFSITVLVFFCLFFLLHPKRNCLCL